MKKFSQITESLDKSFNGLSSSEIYQALESIPRCQNVKCIDISYVYRLKDGDETATLEEIKKGSYVSDYDEDTLYAPEFIFKFDIIFSMEKSSYYHEVDGNQSEIYVGDLLSLKAILEITKSIENATSELSDDFYMFLDIANSEFLNKGLSSKQGLSFSMSFIMKDKFDRDTIIYTTEPTQDNN